MTERETGFLGRYGRFVWGGAAALLLLVLAASFVLSGSSVSSAEATAQAHAQNLASSVVEEQLTPDLLARDIDGTDYRDLTVRVQAGILSDDRFEVVRIWRLDGALIYSTAQRDDVNGVVAPNDRWIQQALGGQTVSVISSNDTYHEGLKRPTEELFQTFVPIRLSGDTIDGVVQIDQRYGAIHNAAFRTWRPVQAVVLLLLIGAGVMLARTFRSRTSYGEGGVERRASPGRRSDDLSVRDAVDRASRAERRVRDTEKRVEELEAQLARAPSTATATAAVEELDLKLRASEAEREELASTVKRLQSELAEKVAELSLAREGSAGTRGEAKRVNKLIADAESKVVAAERKAAAAEQKSQDASKRASVSAERALELEAQLREAQKQAADAEKVTASAQNRNADSERGIEQRFAEAEREAERKVAEAERNAQKLVADTERIANEKVAQAEGEKQTLVAEARREAAEMLAQAERRATEAEKQAADARALIADAEHRATEAGEGARPKESGDRKELKRAESERDELASKLAELERALAQAQARAEVSERELAVKNLELNASAEATASAEALQDRATAAELKFADSQERVADAQSQLADALAKLRELEEARASLDEGKGEDQPPRAVFGATKELEARIAELENARRADVVELQRAQEAFANTQLELSNATRKLRAAESRVKELERSGGRGGATAPEPKRKAEAPVPNYVAAADDPSAWDDAIEDPLGDVPDTLPDETWSQPVVEEVAEEPAEGLSLRERLSRAAAARRRIS